MAEQTATTNEMESSSSSATAAADTTSNSQDDGVRGHQRGVVSTAILKAMSYVSFEKIAGIGLAICGLYFLTDPLNNTVQVKALCGVLIIRFFVKAERKAIEFGAVNRYNKEQKEAKERVIQAAKLAEQQKKKSVANASTTETKSTDKKDN